MIITKTNYAIAYEQSRQRVMNMSLLYKSMQNCSARYTLQPTGLPNIDMPKKSE